MSDETILRTLRAMAWQRAKGEIESLLHTFWNEKEQFDAMDAEFRRFVKEVEDNGLAS